MPSSVAARRRRRLKKRATMEYREHEAPEPLRSHVQCLWHLRDPMPSGAPQTVYPDGRCELIVHLGAPMQIESATRGWQTQSRCLFAAQARRAIRLRAIGALDCIGVRLRPQASAALGAPVNAPSVNGADPVHDLSTIDAPFADALTQSLRDGAEPTAPAFIDLLCHRLGPYPIDARIAAAVTALDGANGNLSVRAVAAAVGVSVRGLQGRFLAAVGLTVKEYALVHRLQATIRQLDAGDAALAQTALAVGFADQAHATRALRAFAGMTPARLRNALRAQRDGDQTVALAAAFVRGASMPA
jgi:AraC-like DNA-binding protein